MLGEVLNLPRGEAEGKPSKDELWEATRQLLEQNESQVTALGYNLRSVQKNIRGISGDFEKFKENSRTCLKALEQRCNQISSKIDEERSSNKRSISALQVEVAELKARTSGRSSKTSVSWASTTQRMKLRLFLPAHQTVQRLPGAEELPAFSEYSVPKPECI